MRRRSTGEGANGKMGQQGNAREERGRMTQNERDIITEWVGGLLL